MVKRRIALWLALACSAASCLQHERAIGPELFACEYGGTCACQVDKDCDDANACTIDHCDADLGCTKSASTDVCDDGNPCTVNETCVQLACKGGKAKVCDDHDPCTSDSCGVSVGCIHVMSAAVSCADGDLCTIDTCASGACNHAATLGPCDDGDVCTNSDECASGSCKGTTVNCDDNNPCTEDTCAAASGCVHKPKNCDDINPCTADGCESTTGTCTNTVIDPKYPFYCANSGAICGGTGMCWGPNAVDCETVVLCPDACHACGTGLKYDCEKKSCL